MWYITRRYIHLAVLSWGPVLGAMLVMFLASAQPKYGQPATTESVTVYFSGAMPIFPGLWELLIKKSAHVIAYGMLALLSMRALIAWQRPLREAGYLAIVCAVSYALLDEVHQAFVPGRHMSGLDVGLDFIGAALFALAVRRYYTGRPRLLYDLRRRFSAIRNDEIG